MYDSGCIVSGVRVFGSITLGLIAGVVIRGLVAPEGRADLMPILQQMCEQPGIVRDVQSLHLPISEKTVWYVNRTEIKGASPSSEGKLRVAVSVDGTSAPTIGVSTEFASGGFQYQVDALQNPEGDFVRIGRRCERQ